MSMANWRAAQPGELHARHAYAGSRDQERGQDLPLLPLEITRGVLCAGCSAADQTLAVGEQGDPHGSRGVCVDVKEAAACAAWQECDQARQSPAPRPPSGKVQELCLERGTSPLRNPEVVWGEPPTPKSSKFPR